MHLPTARDHAAAVSITALMSPHRGMGEDGMDLLKRAVEAIDINSPLIADYQTWINLLRAIKAACGGDEASSPRLSCRGWRATPTTLRRVWSGWRSGGRASATASLAPRMCSAWPQHSVLQKEITAPLMPSPTDQLNPLLLQLLNLTPEEMALRWEELYRLPEAHWLQTIPTKPFPTLPPAVFQLSTYSEDRGWVKLESGVWVQNPTISVQSVTSAPNRSALPIARKRGGADRLSAQQRPQAWSVERTMRHHPAFFARKEDFDADPWLLDTPGGIWDMRTGTLSAHGPLMRMQTAVTPDMFAYGHYDTACPQWMAYLDFVADGRPEGSRSCSDGAAITLSA